MHDSLSPAPTPLAPAPVAVVIVSWNSSDELSFCLDAVQAETPAEIVVIDNGSRDGTPELVRAEYPEVRLIPLGENRGFAAGCNIGVHASAAPYVLFLNADATLEPGYLRTLVGALAADPRAASATGKLVFWRDGTRYIDSAGIRLCAYALRPLDRGYGEVDHGQYDRRVTVFGPSGAAALYRRSALVAAGPQAFDEDFFAYYEDVDLAWRLRRLGYRHLYEPHALACHERRGAKRKPRDIAERAFINRYATWLKNESLGRFLLYAPLALGWELLRLVRRYANGGTLDWRETRRRLGEAWASRARPGARGE